MEGELERTDLLNINNTLTKKYPNVSHSPTLSLTITSKNMFREIGITIFDKKKMSHQLTLGAFILLTASLFAGHMSRVSSLTLSQVIGNGMAQV